MMTSMRRCVPLLLLVFFGTNLFADECHRGFEVADPIITSLYVTSAVYGDFNEDGLVDVAYNWTGERVVAFNRGNGVFEFQPHVTEGGGQGYGFLIAAVDVNGDHHLDLIYSAASTAALIVAFGDGHGTFAAGIQSSLSSSSQRWMFDVNHDGVPDFIEALTVNSFRVALGARNGTFVEGPIVAVSGVPGRSDQIVAGDFDGDGFVDVAQVETTREIAYAWGTADPAKFVLNAAFSGTFELSGRVAVADLDGDGSSEIVCGNTDVLHVARSVNRVTTASILPVPGMLPFSALMDRDMNGDGRRDLVVSRDNATTIGIALGDAGGGFMRASFVNLPGAGGYFVIDGGFTVIDAYGDGSQNVVTTSGQQGLRMISGTALAAGTDAAPLVSIGDVSTINHVQVYDVDGDGNDDMVISRSARSTIEVMLNDGAGHFHPASAPKQYSNPNVVGGDTVGDFDGDGRADLALSSSSAQSKSTIRFDNDQGVFGPSSTIVDVDTFIGLLHVGRNLPPALLGRRGPDLCIVNSSSGRSVQITVIAQVTAATTVTIADMDDDGVDEVLLSSGTNAAGANAEIHVMKGPAAPWQEVAKLSLYSTTSGPFSVVAADLNRDGRLDIVLVYEGLYVVGLAQPDGTCATKQYFVWGSVVGVSVVDFDRDGAPDLAITTHQNYGDPGFLQIVRNTGGGQFEPYATALINQPFAAPVLIDADGDGWMDLIVSNAAIEIIRNICETPRLRVTAYPAAVNAGQQTTLVVHSLSTDGFAIGGITIRERGKIVAQGGSNRAFDGATMTWTTPPLSAGTHTYDVEYVDQFAGSSQTRIAVTAVGPSDRHRAAHH
jgi:hypothetical protein